MIIYLLKQEIQELLDQAKFWGKQGLDPATTLSTRPMYRSGIFRAQTLLEDLTDQVPALLETLEAKAAQIRRESQKKRVDPDFARGMQKVLVLVGKQGSMFSESNKPAQPHKLLQSNVRVMP